MQLVSFGCTQGHKHNTFKWPSGIDSRLGRNRLGVRFLAVSDIYPMFIEPTITWVPSGFSGYIWLDTKIVFKKKKVIHTYKVSYYCACVQSVLIYGTET